MNRVSRHNRGDSQEMCSQNLPQCANRSRAEQFPFQNQRGTFQHGSSRYGALIGDLTIHIYQTSNYNVINVSDCFLPGVGSYFSAVC